MTWNLKDLPKLESKLLVGSTLVEGSTLTEAESRQVLAGRTVQGHSVQEVRELLNHRSAVEWLIRELKPSPFLSKDLILDFHRRLFTGLTGESGQWKRTPNYTYLSSGVRLDYAKPKEVDAKMARWIQDFNDSVELEKRSELISRGTKLYYQFQWIHPFEDGNGRVGRVLAAYWFHWKAGLGFSFYLKDKADHLSALEAANEGDLTSLQSFFKKRLVKEL